MFKDILGPIKVNKSSHFFHRYTKTFEQKLDLLFIVILLINFIRPLLHAPHINYTTYNTGTLNFFNGIDPYPAEWIYSQAHEHLQWFLYHPSFCIFFAVFSTAGLGMYAGIFSWLTVNLIVFWIGFIALISLLDSKTNYLKGRWFFLSLFLMFNEVQAPLLNHHVNVFVAGIMMLGLAAYMKQYFIRSAFFLSIGVAFKVLPIVLVLLLFLEFNWKFISYTIGFLLFLFVLPLLFIPNDFYFEILKHWINILLTEPLRTDYIGLQPTLEYFGWGVDSLYFSIFMMINALAIAIVAYKVFPLSRSQFVRFVFPLAVLFLLIFNKRTETPTFVFIAPLYAFMLHAILHERQRKNFLIMWIHISALSISWILTTYVYTDLCPYDLRQIARQNHIKIFGLIAMYAWSWFQVFMIWKPGHISERA